MSIKNIRKQLKEAGIDAKVRYLANEIRAAGYCIDEYTCLYDITFPKIDGKDYDEEYWDTPVEVIDQYDAACVIEDYLKYIKGMTILNAKNYSELT